MENKRVNTIMNKNWETMQGILDKEMPVQKKKRRVLWLWMLFGFLACSSAVYIAQHNEMTEQSKPIDKEPIKAITPQKNDFAHIEHKVNDPKDQSQVLRSENAENFVNSDGDTKQKQLPNQALNTNVTYVSEVIHSELTGADITNVALISETPMESSALNNNILPAFVNVEMLANQDISLLNYNHKLSGLTVLKEQNRIFKLGLLSSIATTNFESLSSYFVGIQGERKLNKSLAIYSNLGWRQYKGSNTNIQSDYNYFRNNHIELTNATNSDPLADARLNQLIVRDITKTVSYIELSGGLKYQLFNGLAIQSSINLGYLVKETYAIDEETRVNFEDLAKNYSIDNIISSAEENNLHQKWVMHFNIGLEARMYRSLYFYSNIHRLISLNNQSASLVDNLDTENSWLELGVKYNLKD